MTVTDVTIPAIRAFCNLEPKAQALKPLEEAAEVFGAWQNIDRMSAKFVNVGEASAAHWSATSWTRSPAASNRARTSPRWSA